MQKYKKTSRYASVFSFFLSLYAKSPYLKVMILETTLAGFINNV